MFEWLRGRIAPSVEKELGVIVLKGRKTLKLRVFTFFFFVLCLAVAEFSVPLFWYVAALGVLEIVLYTQSAHFLKTRKTFTNLNFVFFASLELLAMSYYTGLGFFAAFSQSVSIVLMGLLWTAGCLYYAQINFVRGQHLNMVHILPPAFGLIVFTALTGSQPLAASTNFDWVASIAGALLLIHASHELGTDQRRIAAALKKAKRESAERLAALQYGATHDDLTGLLNRTAFNERLSLQLDQYRRTGKAFSLLLMDLDGFKPINDAFGHPAGDALLSEVSGRLRNTVGRNGIVARVGGDEFGIILSHTSDRDELEDIALDLIRTVSLPTKFRKTNLAVGASVGTAICTKDLNGAEKLIAAADEALYQAKDNKKSSVVLYHPGITRKRVSIEERWRIEYAIKKRLIKPYYQPKFCLRTREVVGFEALARWPLDPLYPIGSSRFVEKIEQLGMLSEFTYCMTKQVFGDVGKLLKEGYNPGCVSINLSEVSLATMNGLEDLEWLLAENPEVIPHITLEITEDVFIARAGNRIRESIEELRNIGVGISLDDFGTGFASFQHLRQLDFDELKIDTEFVRGLGKDPTANVIVDGFLSIAQGLGVSVVAEGVETEAQRLYLLERGCPVGQGFLHSKAQPFHDIHKYLKPQKGRLVVS